MTLNQKVNNPYIPEPMRIVRRFNLIPGVRFFQIRPLSMKRALEFRYKPGQFLMLSVFGAGEAPFSITSTPTRPTLEVCIRATGSVTHALARMKEGDKVGLRGPFGNTFAVPHSKGKNVVMVCGGLGVVPLRSMINYVLDNREDYKQVYIMYGTRDPSQILFRDEIKELESRQ